MQIKHDTRKAPEIERAASKDESLPVLCHAYLNVEEGTLEATDSFMAVIVVPVEIEDGDTYRGSTSNAIKLLELAKALGSDGEVMLEFRRQRNTSEEGEAVGYFPDRLGPMKVTIPSGGDSWGILMPIRVP